MTDIQFNQLFNDRNAAAYEIASAAANGYALCMDESHPLANYVTQTILRFVELDKRIKEHFNQLNNEVNNG